MDIAKIKHQLIADPEVRDRVARRAFEIYLQRHGGPGSAAEDWLRAESEILPRLIDEIVERNRAAIASHDESDPTVKDAAENMRHELESAHAGETVAPAAAKPARKAPARKAAEKSETMPKAEAKKPAAKSAAKPTAKPAAAKPAAKKVSAKKVEATVEDPATKPTAKKVPARKKD